MRRLFVFGDSYTTYKWPTWATILSQQFDYYENWAAQAQGNNFIANRISECDLKNHFTKDDTIVVVWSEHLRYDNVVNGSWRYEKVYDGNIPYADEFGAFIRSFNAINLSYNYLANSRATFYMSAIKPLEYHCADYYFSKKSNLFEKFSHLKQFQQILERPNWLAPFEGGVLDYNGRRNEYRCFNHDPFWDRMYKGSNLKYNGIHWDIHPTPALHYEWLDRSGLIDALGLDRTTMSYYKDWNRVVFDTASYEAITEYFSELINSAKISTHY